MPRFSFKTVGCRLNQAETARISAQLIAAGYEEVPFGSPCDIAIIHGCAVTREAERKSIRFARSAKRLESAPCVVLMGCVAEVGGPDIRQSSGADIIASQADKWRLPDLLGKAGFMIKRACSDMETHGSRCVPVFHTTRAIIKVQDGCDFRCTYCIVPDARGLPVSRSVLHVLDEIEALSLGGYKEFVLTGANLSRYRDDSSVLVDLLRSVDALSCVERIRLSSVELFDNAIPLIDLMASSRKICRFLHVPLQSGDDGILSRMGRRYNAARYIEILKYAYDKLEKPGLGTDVIVGFPGEDERAFENTFNLVSELPFSNVHIFPYSPRPGTPAANMSDQVPEPEKRKRVDRLSKLADEKRRAFASEFLNRPVSVLIERLDARGTGIGWSEEYLETHVQRPGLQLNSIVRVPVNRVSGDILYSCSGTSRASAK